MPPPGWVPEVVQGPDGPYAECPDCRTKISTGVGGIGNLTKQHMNTKTCKAAKKKHDHETARRVAAEKQKNSMKGWLSGQAKKLVPSKISNPASTSRPTPSGPSKPSRPSKQQKPMATPATAAVPVSFLARLRALILSLPQSIPEGMQSEPLGKLPVDPSSFDDPSVEGAELWENGINLVMKSVIDWGDKTDLKPYIRRGTYGLDGLLCFCEYFVKRGVPEGLFEGKLTRLTAELERHCTEPATGLHPSIATPLAPPDTSSSPASAPLAPPSMPLAPTTSPLAPTTAPLPSATAPRASLSTPLASSAPPAMPLAPTTSSSPLQEASPQPLPVPESRRRSMSISSVSIPTETIDLTSFEYEDTLNRAPTMYEDSPRCSGYALVLPNLPSTVRRYPFPLHDPELFPKQELIPWEARTKNGMVVLTSKDCLEFASKEQRACKRCLQLTSNKTLQGILDRMENGTHDNTPLMWHGFESMRAKMDRKNEHIEFLRLRGLNQVKTLLRKAAAITDHKRLLMTIASGKVQRVDRVIDLALKQKKGIRGVMASVYAAGEGLYSAKSFKEREAKHALLVWRLGGNRVAEINHRALKTPGLTYLRKFSKIPPLTASPGPPTTSEIRENAKLTVGGLLDVLKERFGDTPVRHAVLMYDELKTESRIRYDLLTNHFLGVCRAHGSHVSLKFVNEGDMKALFRAIDDGKVHCAGEATIAALGILSNDSRIYAGRPILISGDCKQETGTEHLHSIIDPTLEAMESLKAETNIRITSITSDGESRRGVSFISKTFKKVLSSDSPIYETLQPLKLLDLHCGDDDLTCDKDWKHVFKRFRNLLLRQKGIVVNGVRITPDITRDHLRQSGVLADHIRAIFKPDDKQDVKLAFDLLQAIWSLPEADSSKSPGFLATNRGWFNT